MGEARTVTGRSGKGSDNRKQKWRTMHADDYESLNKPDSKQINQLILDAATLKLKVGLINIAGLTPQKKGKHERIHSTNQRYRNFRHYRNTSQ